MDSLVWTDTFTSRATTTVRLNLIYSHFKNLFFNWDILCHTNNLSSREQPINNMLHPVAQVLIIPFSTSRTRPSSIWLITQTGTTKANNITRKIFRSTFVKKSLIGNPTIPRSIYNRKNKQQTAMMIDKTIVVSGAYPNFNKIYATGKLSIWQPPTNN